MLGPIFTAILSIFGPILADALRRLLEKWLAKAATVHGGATFATRESQLQLVTTAITLVPWYRPRVRNALEKVKAGLERGEPLGEVEAAQMLGVVGDAADE